MKEYFQYLPKLIEEFPLNICIAYMFSLVELAHNMTLYCAVVKLHRVKSELARIAVNNQHITKDHFKELYETIIGKKIKKATFSKIENAAKIRDKILHGKSIPEQKKREAIFDILSYAEAFNSDVSSIAGFTPFGRLQGYRGRGTPLNASTSRWVLKGVGFKNM